MTLLPGWIEGSPAGGVLANPLLAQAMSGFVLDEWPPHEALIGPFPVLALATAGPVSTTPRLLAGWKTPTFGDDWYHRIHINPSLLDLGNVVSAQVSLVRVWNAYLDAHDLTGIAGLDAEGIAVEGADALPMVVAALRETTWAVSVTPQGPATIDLVLTWLFAGVSQPRLRITATRVVAWAFAPDWADGVLERLAWATDILGSPRAAEQRRALRLAPRRWLENRVVVQGRERALLDLSLAGWGSRVWALPIWPDVQWLGAAVAVGAASIACTTTGRDFRAGGLAMLLGTSPFESETVEIDSLTAGAIVLRRPTQASWPVGTRLLPVRSARLDQQPSLTRVSDRAYAADVVFRVEEPSDWPAAELPTYRGAPVLALRPDEAENLTGSWQRLLMELDTGSALPVVTDTADLGFNVQQHRWRLVGRAEHTAWRSLMYLLRGRQGALWLPTHAEDLVLAATAAASATAIDVQATGYTRFAVGRVGRRDIRIELSDGSALHRRIIGASEIDAQTERLALDAVPGVQLEPAGAGTAVRVTRISFMQLARQDHDEVEIHHATDADGTATTQSVFVGVRDDLESP